MAVLSDFVAAVNQIAAERGIEAEDVLDAIKSAIRTSYKNKYGEGENLVVELNEESGDVEVFADKKVVKKVTDKSTQISIDNARKIEPKLEAGDHVQVDITPEGDFGRIAVQAARQVILQKVREAEKEAVMKEFKDQIGTVESGIVQRMRGDDVLVEIRKAVAVMPAEERLPGEFYKSGARLKFYLKKIEKSPRGKQLILSRNDPEFLKQLFALEVPEIRSGSVEIKAVARESGSRSKVAVASNQEGVDPIGACVGQKGIRIENITEELMGEKIDIILWDESIKTFISNSLSPAEVGKIEIDEEEKTAMIEVPEDQLSLAIGKDGQNVRLAAKLTGWKIDISGEGGEVKASSEEEEQEDEEEEKSQKQKKMDGDSDEQEEKEEEKKEKKKGKKKGKKKKENKVEKDKKKEKDEQKGEEEEKEEEVEKAEEDEKEEKGKDAKKKKKKTKSKKSSKKSKK